MRKKRLLGAIALGTATLSTAFGVACSGDYTSLYVATDGGSDATALPATDAAGDGQIVITPTGPSDSGSAIDAGPECKGQRVVSVVGGDGAFAWFTLVWPLPSVITGYQSGYAYDDPTLAVLAPGSTTDHPLYARAYDEGGVTFADAGSHPLVSAYLVSSVQAFTNTPHELQLNGMNDMLAVAATRNPLGAPLETAVIAIDSTDYVAAAGQYPAAQIDDVQDAISYVATKASLDDAGVASLTMDDATFLAWTGTARASTPNAVASLADSLYLAAQLFRRGLTTTLETQYLDSRPEHAFADEEVTLRANAIASVLDHFYGLLSTIPEPSCAHDGHAISLADNVVLVVTGDTPYNSFAANPEWTSGALSNLAYVRSNGYLVGGWFGTESSAAATYFDPTTGNPSATATAAQDQTAMALALLNALTRGDATFVNNLSASPYQGEVSAATP